MSLLASLAPGTQGRRRQPALVRRAESSTSEAPCQVEDDGDNDVLGLPPRRQRVLCGHSKAVQLGILNAQTRSVVW